MAVRFGEHQRFRNLFPFREYLVFYRTFEFFDHRTDLTWIDDVLVEFRFRILYFLIRLFPAFFPRETVTDIDVHLCGNDRAFFAHFRFDDVLFETHIHAIGHGLFVCVFAHHILVEETVGAVIGRCGQSNKECVEILQHLPPQIVNTTVAFVNDDDIEHLNRHFRVVIYRNGLFDKGAFVRVIAFETFVQFFPFQDAVHPLNGADANLRRWVNVAARKPLYRIEFRKLPFVIVRSVTLEFLFGLFAQVFGVNQKEHAFGLYGLFQQTVNGCNGRKCFARTRSHLHQSSRLVRPERFLQFGDGVYLAISQTRMVESRKCGQSFPK